MKSLYTLVGELATFLASLPGAAAAQAPSPDLAAFRATYKELVETNTTYSSGNCTQAAQEMAAKLKAAGYPDSDLHVFVAPGHPKEGGLVAILHGADPSKKGILLLAHIDVVEARRDQWNRDPFKLVEENGYFYGRGTSDDKAMAAVWVDSLVRYRKEGFRPLRDIKMALTCGEETAEAFNGAAYLVKNKRPWVGAGIALNEGAAGRLDDNGNRVDLEVEAGEKVYQDFTLKTASPGGHSSRPVKDNAIYHLANGLARLGAYEFPVQFNDATRLYWARMANLLGGSSGAAMQAILKNPEDPQANAVLAEDPNWHAMMRTTCVATRLAAGHANNALPQEATANVNCRIFPGTSVETIQKRLVKVLDDPHISVSVSGPISATPPPPPLTAAILNPIEKVASELWPGVPVVPTLSTGATDGVNTNAANIPTYGLSGMFRDPDGDGVHGLNERIRVRSLYEGREFLYRVVKLYASSAN